MIWLYVKSLFLSSLMLPFNSILAQEMGIIRLDQFEQALSQSWTIKKNNYQYEAKLNLYFTKENIYSLEKLIEQLNLAQNAFKKCKIQLKINSINLFKPHLTNFYEYESYDFNNDQITDWERDFFQNVSSNSAGILFVKSLNWTMGINGYLAIAYAPFYFEKTRSGLNQNEIDFFENKMLHHAVIGEFAQKWTLTHELGHSLLNLEHSNIMNNIMLPLMDKGYNPEFTMKQCEEGLKSNRIIKRITPRVNSKIISK